MLIIEDYQELVYLQTLLKKIGFDVLGTQNLRGIEETQLGFNPDLIFLASRAKQDQLEPICEQIKKRSKKVQLVFVQDLKSSSPRATNSFFSLFEGHLKSPVNPKDLFLLIGRLGELDGEYLVEKYKKIRSQLSQEDETELLLIKHEEQSIGERTSADFERLSDSLEELNAPLEVLPSAEEAVSPSGSELSSEAEIQSAEDLPILKGEKLTKVIDLPERDYSSVIAGLEPLKEMQFDAKKVRAYHRKIRKEPPDENSSELDQERQLFVKALFKSKD